MSERPSSYIVSGAAGFIGSNLCAALLRREPGAHILAVDDMRTGSYATLVEACVRCGVGSWTGELVVRSVEEIDFVSAIEQLTPAAVFHLGAITDTTITDERLMMRVNAESFAPILTACAESGTPLVYASSAATYGTPREAIERRPFPESAAGIPNNVYGFSKWQMEQVHRRLAGEAHVVGLRYFNVFGPGESRKGKMASMIYQLALAGMSGTRLRLFADGSQSRDHVHVDDVVEATIAGASRGAKSGVYNVGSGRATSFAAIADAVRAGLGKSDSQLPTEYFEMPADVRRFYQDYTCADISSTEKGLAWRPRIVPTEGMASYVRSLAASARVS